MLFADIHAHIQQHERTELDGIVERAEAAGIGAIVVSGTTAEDSRLCVELAESHKTLFAGVGAHPTELSGPLTSGDLHELDRLARHERVVVMSEVGIDHQAHVLERPSPVGRPWTDIQDEALRAQIEVARENGLALVFHVREPGDNPDAGAAWPHALRVLRETGAGELGGAAHYFQGNRQAAFDTLDAGFNISFARPLIRLRHLWEIAQAMPFDRIVLESDSYPQPFKKDRTKWTEPWHVLEVATRLAEVRGVTVNEVRERTSENALRMMGRRGEVVRRALGGE